MARVHKQSPWIEYYEQLEVLFEEDSQVRVLYDDKEQAVRLYVTDVDKADALQRVLPEKKVFGNVELKVTVIPANDAEPKYNNEPILVALMDNPIVEEIKRVSGIFSDDIIYIAFRREVVQYYADNLGDINGNCNTLYQDIAKNVFTLQAGVFFCTTENEWLGFSEPDFP